MLVQLVQKLLQTGHLDLMTDGSMLVGILLALVTGIAFHEFSHAFTAWRLGDPTPMRQGRVTLNPAAHIEATGALFFLLAGFGWGRPVQFQPYLLRMNPRTGSALVAVAGPIANLILATIFGLLLRLVLSFVTLGPGISPAAEFGLNVLYQYVYFNLILAFFNLLPVPPLDGFNILVGILPPQLAYPVEQLRPYGFLVLMALFLVGGGLVGRLLYPPVDAMFQLLVGF